VSAWLLVYKWLIKLTRLGVQPSKKKSRKSCFSNFVDELCISYFRNISIYIYPYAPCMLYLPTKLDDFVWANVGKYSSTMVRIWDIFPYVSRNIAQLSQVSIFFRGCYGLLPTKLRTSAKKARMASSLRCLGTKQGSSITKNGVLTIIS